MDIEFSLSDVLQSRPRLCRNGSERLLQQIRTVSNNVFVRLQQALHRVADCGIQFLGINVTATALGMSGFPVIALPDSVPVGCGIVNGWGGELSESYHLRSFRTKRKCTET